MGIKHVSTSADAASLGGIRDEVKSTRLAGVGVSIIDLEGISAQAGSLSSVWGRIARALSAVLIPPRILLDAGALVSLPDLSGITLRFTSVGELVELFALIHAIAPGLGGVGERVGRADSAFAIPEHRVKTAHTFVEAVTPDFVGSAVFLLDTINSNSGETVLAEANSVEENLVGSTSPQASAVFEDDTVGAEVALSLPEVSELVVAFFQKDAAPACTFVSIAGNIPVDNSPLIVDEPLILGEVYWTGELVRTLFSGGSGVIDHLEDGVGPGENHIGESDGSEVGLRLVVEDNSELLDAKLEPRLVDADCELIVSG